MSDWTISGPFTWVRPSFPHGQTSSVPHPERNPESVSKVLSRGAAQPARLGEELAVTSVRIWGPGVGAVVVLVATGAWAHGTSGGGTAGVDTGLWAAVRPAIEARLVAQAQGDGPGESEPALRARWFCAARALDLRENDGRVRAGVDTLCVEYGVRDGALQECGGAHVPQVVRLERDDDTGGYHVVAQEEPPDGAGYADWEKDHFGVLTEYRLDAAEPAGLESAARAHFGLPADTPVGDC